MRRCAFVGSLLVLISVALFLLSCSSSSSSNLATVQVSLSDPSTCSAPQGAYAHIYVTVSDVIIHQSATVAANDAGWVDLTPDLKNNPVQVDLLGSSNQCFLAQLGSSGIQPGSYQQIRVLLAPNSASPANNHCGSAANCIILASDPSATPQSLQLSSESQTGIKIPSGQIAGGKFIVASGDSKDLNLDFDACRSIHLQGNGQYRLNPVLHAGEVTLQSASTSISGTVIDSGTMQPIVGGTTVVAVEQPDTDGVDRVIMETVADSNGGFSFCPLPAGSYDVVVDAVSGAGTAYTATIITGVQPGNTLGNVPLTSASMPASITGNITTSTGSAATSADLAVSALQSITVNNANLLVTIPLAAQSMSTASLTTQAGMGCPVNTDCASYTLSVPASNPSVGAFMMGNQSPGAPAVPPVGYTIDAVAFVPGSGGQTNCSPSDLETNQTSANTPLNVTSGMSVTAATLAFTGCQ
ncbi:MAG TPA: DUF4382 domain-containing protein [Terriglobales bacterium]|nr:DUF4382 domain-containing protein [Terriglobales bacterium]